MENLANKYSVKSIYEIFCLKIRVFNFYSFYVMSMQKFSISVFWHPSDYLLEAYSILYKNIRIHTYIAMFTLIISGVTTFFSQKGVLVLHT